MAHKDPLYQDLRCKRLLSAIEQARQLGLRRIDDVLAHCIESGATLKPGRPLKRSAFYRAWRRLRELDLEAGPDDLGTARYHGRPTKPRTHN
jgi:hypothetical protein